MKKILIILFCLISISLNATIYYCSSTGTDGAYPTRGTFANPWKTWHYAFSHTTPSDTCYFRGGVYDPYSTTIGATINYITSDGTHSKPTCFFAYPSDFASGNYPVMDCATMVVANKAAVKISRASNLYFKGLQVRNVFQTSNDYVIGWWLWSESYTDGSYIPNAIKFENCAAYNIGTIGFSCSRVDTVYVINCDAWNCADTLNAADPGGSGNGFEFGPTWSNSPTAGDSYGYFYGNRAWNCSDQTYAMCGAGTIIMDHCWGINAGNVPFPTNIYSKGSGVKLWFASASYKNTDILQVTIRNCIFAYSAFIGINWTDYSTWGSYPEVRAHIYNNFIYRSIYQVTYHGTPWGFGVQDAANSDTVGSWDHKYYNNLSYLNVDAETPEYRDNITGVRHESNNLFDVIGTPVTNLYFLSLDTAGMMGLHEREADWSLPDTDFGKPSSTSPLVDAGVDVFGIDFIGTAPDIGWAEYDARDTTALTVFTTSAYASINYALVGGNVYDDGGDEVTSRGVCWGTSANPTIANDTTINGSGTGAFVARLSNLLTSTTYHARAYAINQWGVGYGEDLSFTTLSPTDKVALYSGGKPITDPATGKHIYINIGSAGETVLVTGITVSGTGGATTITTDGGTLQMLASVLPTNATDKTVIWSVSIGDGGTASINSTTGLLTALTDGDVTVTATANDASGISDDQVITISNQDIVTSIDIWGTGGATTISSAGGTLQMLKKTLPITASDTTVTWTRTNGTGTASISTSGLLTALTDGTVTVRATANDGSAVYGEEVITISNQSVEETQIIADHTIVDRYDDIPAEYITEVKKMWVVYSGESHSNGIRNGLALLEAANPTYDVNITTSGTPEAYTTSHLRSSNAWWTGDQWFYYCGEGEWWTNAATITRMKDAISYANSNSLTISALGLAWCWDMCNYNGPSAGTDPVYGVHWWGSSEGSPSGNNLPWGLDDADNAVSGNVINLDTYLAATQSYIDYCTTNSINTKVFFTTGPVDTYYENEPGYQAHLKHERIRDYVDADATRILFDYADILCYNDDGSTKTENWGGHTYPIITAANEADPTLGHISYAGALRLGKALWWMLARMAGWDGN